MSRLMRLFIAIWFLIGWAPHGVCGVGADLVRQAAPAVKTTPVSQAIECPYCGRNQVLGAVRDAERNSTDSSSQHTSSNRPNDPQNGHPCCHPHPGLLSADSFVSGLMASLIDGVAWFAWDETQSPAGLLHEQPHLAENLLAPPWQNVPLYLACCSLLT
ncbi:hypothetical protein [Thermogutta sp.]|uniref:hypothetical protein n=1 Tax=Thermogutta sp. TaxID=1962930 RepID=UPI003C799750